eukprot:COSAG04_NODE_87_length_27437_cov_64.782939_4_plen_65_part_00
MEPEPVAEPSPAPAPKRPVRAAAQKARGVGGELAHSAFGALAGRRPCGPAAERKFITFYYWGDH